jgi:hypothetical protein
LLIRHLFGFKESRRSDACVFSLTPSLPPPLMRPGARYGLSNLTYRGRAFDAWYTVLSPTTLRAYVGEESLEVVLGQSRDFTLP